MARARASKTIRDTEFLEPRRVRLPEPQRLSASSRGMVASAHWCATAAGVEMLEEGGNAIDAAVATAFALGVCEPAASGLGGQTMMMVHLAPDRRTFALDGSSRAPNRTRVEETDRRARLRGHRATTVPSTPAVLGYALERHGTLPLSRVLEPAIRLAEEGYQISELQAALTRRELRHLKARSAGKFILDASSRPYPVGTVFKQAALGSTLRQLAAKGVRDFYTGKIARAIRKDMEEKDGWIRKDDLAQIPLPIERRPLASRFAESRVFTFPEPGAGRTLIEMLHIVEHLPPRLRDIDRPAGAVALAEVIRRANLDRQDRPFDPNYFPQVDREDMLRLEYAKRAARHIRKRVQTEGETTHLSVIDRDFNAVGLTQSIERVFGSVEASPELGFLYNNYMSAFEYEDMTHPYYLRPNAVPWASVAPTIIFRGRRPWLVIGSPGSERITSAILQVLMRLQNQSPMDAVSAPRLHCSIGGKVSLECSRMRDDIPRSLARRGFTLDPREAHSFYLGCVQLVVRQEREFVGVADLRRDGSAGGPER